MKILQESGNRLKRKAIQNLSLTVLCLMSLVVIVLTSARMFPLYIELGRYEGVRILVMLFPLFGVLFFRREYRKYKHGFEGEDQVAKTLSSSLSNEYCLINDWCLDGKMGNIDHIVLGPTGIFAIETKNQGGRIECNGDVWRGVVVGNPSKQARGNAVRVSDAIANLEIFKSGKPWVQAVVVFANNDLELVIHNLPFKVDILRVDGLVNYILTKESRRLSSQEIESAGEELLAC